jgi:hypothetical protein
MKRAQLKEFCNYRQLTNTGTLDIVRAMAMNKNKNKNMSMA